MNSGIVFEVDEKRVGNLFREMGSPKEPHQVRAFLDLYGSEVEEFLAASLRKFLLVRTQKLV